MRFISSTLYLSLTGLALLLSVSVMGCSQPASSDPDTAVNGSATSQGTVNDNCPIMGGEVSEDAPTVQWNGKTIGFCCAGCDQKFMALSDEEKSEKLAAAAGEAEDAATHSEHDHS